MLEQKIIPTSEKQKTFCDKKAYYFEQDEAPLHYHCEVREFLDDKQLSSAVHRETAVWKKEKELTATKARH